MKIANWPFKSIQNVLDVEIENSAKNPTDTACLSVSQSSVDSEGSLVWLKVTLNGVAAYHSFKIIKITNMKVKE